MRKWPYISLLVVTLAAGYPMCATAFAWATDPWELLYVGVEVTLVVSVIFVLTDLRFGAKWVAVVASFGAVWFTTQFIRAALDRSEAIELFVVGLPAVALAASAAWSVHILRSADGLPQNPRSQADPTL